MKTLAPLLLIACGTNVTTHESSLTDAKIAGLGEGFSWEEITPRTFVLHAYSNAVLFDGDDGLVLIDTMRPEDLGDIKKVIGGLYALGKLRTDQVKTIVNTHWHPDHVGGNGPLHEEGVEIIAGRGTGMRLGTEQHIEFFNATLPPWPPSFWPTRELAGGDSEITQNGMVIKRYPFSHTTSDVTVWLSNERVLVLGDLVLPDMVAFTDVGNGGSTRGLLRSLSDLGIDDLQNVKVVGGHGRVLDAKALRAWVNAIRAATTYVFERVKAGETLAQIQAGPIPAEVTALDTPLLPVVAFIEWIYRDCVARDGNATMGTRQMATGTTVKRSTIYLTIKFAAMSPYNAAGTDYDTIKMVMDELTAIDAFSKGDPIVQPDAVVAFAVYTKYVVAARAEGRGDLTESEWTAMLSEISAL